VRTAEELARLLPQGLLRADRFPELADDEIAEDVRERLAQVGLELVRADEYWLARSRPNEALDGFEPVFELDEAELAVAAALYLHLRYLPRHGRVETTAQGRAAVAVDDIERVFPRYSPTKMRMLLGRLRNAHFVSRADEHFHAGPYQHAFDEVEADERAHEALRNFRLRRYFKRYADRLGVDDAPADQPAEDEAN
jgi:hypothetical protein